MPKMMLQYPVDKKKDADKVRGIMHMHTKHVKVDKQIRATGVYGLVEYYTVTGMFIKKDNAEIARKEINERLEDKDIWKSLS
jgi:hypothetical protein